MNPPASSTRDVLARMLATVEEMQRALREAAPADGDADVTRALAALDDLERRVRQLLEQARG